MSTLSKLLLEHDANENWSSLMELAAEEINRLVDYSEAADREITTLKARLAEAEAARGFVEINTQDQRVLGRKQGEHERTEESLREARQEIASLRVALGVAQQEAAAQTRSTMARGRELAEAQELATNRAAENSRLDARLCEALDEAALFKSKLTRLCNALHETASFKAKLTATVAEKR